MKSSSTKRSLDRLLEIKPSGQRETSFYDQVYEVARQIPPGRVTTYGAIAACLGTRLSARMVGWAMNGAHDASLNVPAHRVVNRNGMLSGKAHFATPTEMEELLIAEGVGIERDIVVDFKTKFWDPATAL